MVSIKGLNKAKVLLSLYNNSEGKYQGFPANNPVNEQDCQSAIEWYNYFDYWCGKLIKIDLSSDEEFDATYYDKHNGQGAAQRAVDLVSKKEI